MVAEMAHLISGANFDPFLRSNHEKCSSLWSAFERLHSSAVGDIGDLIDNSFRQVLHKQPLITCSVLPSGSIVKGTYKSCCCISICISISHALPLPVLYE